MMSEGLRRTEQFLSLLERIGVAIAALIVFALMFLVVFDVLGRKLFNAPIPGSIEAASLTLPAVVFLTIAYIQSRKEHVTVDLFTSGLSRRVQLALDLFVLALGIAVMAVVVAKTSASAWSSTVSGEYAMGLVEVPIWPARVAVALGSWLLALRLLFDFVRACVSLLNARAPDDTPAAESG